MDLGQLVEALKEGRVRPTKVLEAYQVRIVVAYTCW